MVKKYNIFEPQLVVVEQHAGSAVAITNEAKLSLYKKSQKSGISTDILEEVYYRGYSTWNESFAGTPEQFAFDRVNSFIAGGFAAKLDEDLMENWQNSKYKNPEGGLTKAGVMAYRRENPGSKLKTAVTTPPSKLKPGSKPANRRKSFCARMGGMKKRLTSAKTARDPDSRINKALRKWNCREETEIVEKRGLWDNIHAKRARIKAGSDERMRKPGSAGAPTDAAIKASQNEQTDPCWTNYKQIGTKKKNGKSVPNCVPISEKHVGKHFKTKETVELQSKNSNDSDSRFDGTKSVKNVYQRETPGQPVTESTLTLIKRVLEEATRNDIRNIQKDLISKGAKIKADGIIGPKTKAALAKFGTSQNMPMPPNQEIKQPEKSKEEPAKVSPKTEPMQSSPNYVDKISGAGSSPKNYLEPKSKTPESIPAYSSDTDKPIMKKYATTTPSAVGEYSKTPKIKESLTLHKFKEIINEINIRDASGKLVQVKNVKFRGADNKLHSAPPGKSESSGGGNGD